MENITITYGQVADILNKCDSDGTPIYIRLKTLQGNVNVPIDNFEYFREITNADPEDIFPLLIVEDDGVIFLKGID